MVIVSVTDTNRTGLPLGLGQKGHRFDTRTSIGAMLVLPAVKHIVLTFASSERPDNRRREDLGR